MKDMFWTNEKLSLIVAWASGDSISCFKGQSSCGHLDFEYILAELLISFLIKVKQSKHLI